MIDISAITYTDVLKYRADYMSENPVYNITDEEFHRISNAYGMDCSGIKAINKCFRI